MASFFRPYFSLKLAASRTSAKCAADPGCGGGRTGWLHSGNIFGYHKLAHVFACLVRWRFYPQPQLQVVIGKTPSLFCTQCCDVSAVHFLLITRQSNTVGCSDWMFCWYILSFCRRLSLPIIAKMHSQEDFSQESAAKAFKTANDKKLSLTGHGKNHICVISTCNRFLWDQN